jgi:diaminopimelate epimerase
MRFHKYQGAGNDFVIVAGDERPETDWPALARALCPRHLAVGADGLLVCQQSAVADLRMRMYNPDGTEDMCGNGLRCLALYAVDEGLTAGAFRVETLAGVRAVNVGTAREGAAEIRTEMGRADLRPAAIPMRHPGDRAVDVELEVAGEQVRLTALSTGTAHSVLFGPRPDDQRFRRLSPALELHPVFPERTSVLWATPLASSHLSLRIWERGVGETLACGTGACAAAVAARLHGLAGDRVLVDSPGGRLVVEVGPDLDLTLTGPAARVFAGEWPQARGRED